MMFERDRFEAYLHSEEKSTVTIKKYLRDTAVFTQFLGGRELSKDLFHAWKQNLIQSNYSVRSVNSMLASVNAYLRFIGREDCRVRNLKLQRQVYLPADKEMSSADYEKLLKAAKCRPRLKLLLQTLASTGIRISELRFFTVEAVTKGEIVVNSKNKSRVIMIPDTIRKALLAYCRQQHIRQGIIFRTRNGKPLDRSNVWTEMKHLCRIAGVNEQKVFPHNFRKLFARCFYKLKKDIAKLADILGHSSIETTRIYIMTSGLEHRNLLNRVCHMLI